MRNTKALWSKCQNTDQYLYGFNECVCMKCWHGFSEAFYTWIYSSDSIAFSFFCLDSTRLNNSMMVSNSNCGQHFIFFFLFLFNSTSFETCELASLLSHRLLKEEKEFCWSFILNFPESEYIFYFYIRFGYNKKLEMRKYKERDNKNCCRSLYIPGNFVNNKYTVDIVEI